MEPIVTIEGPDLDAFMRQLSWLVDMYERGQLTRVRVAFDEDAVKLKSNEHSWTPPMGEIQPAIGEHLR